MITHLCEISGVSRSGYYNYFTDKSKTSRDKLDKADELVRDNILKVYNFKGRKKGAR